jgi:hypothetical protein
MSFDVFIGNTTNRGIGVMMPANLPKEGYKPLPEQ